jgi:hypothetical protein
MALKGHCLRPVTVAIFLHLQTVYLIGDESHQENNGNGTSVPVVHPAFTRADHPLIKKLSRAQDGQDLLLEERERCPCSRLHEEEWHSGPALLPLTRERDTEGHFFNEG